MIQYIDENLDLSPKSQVASASQFRQMRVTAHLTELTNN